MRRTALAAAVAAVAVAAAAGAPLYDGVGFPDQPYRYLAPPPGSTQTPPPGSASGSDSVAFGLNSAGLHLATDEQGPQVVVDIPGGELRAAAGAHRVTAVVGPVPLGPPPTDGQPDGNVYRYTVTSDAGPVRPVATGSAYVYLRSAVLTTPLPHLDYRPAPSSGWRPLHTDRIGNDIFSAALQGPGDYLVVQPPGARSASQSAGSRRAVLYLVAGGVLLAVLVLLVLRRLGRDREAA